MVHEVPQHRGHTVEVELLLEGDAVEGQAQLADARDALRAVGPERDGTRERAALDQIPRRLPRRSLESIEPEPGDELACLGRRGAVAEQIGEVEREEQRAKQRRLRGSVIAVRNRAEGEQ